MKTIDTERLRLRPFLRDDLVAVHRLLYADPEVAPWWTGRVKTLEEVRSGFARKCEPSEGRLGWTVVALKAGGALIGAMGFQRWQPEEETDWLIFEHPEDALRSDPSVVEVELTYAFGRAYWGQGYATEAAIALLAYGFGELGVTRVVNTINSANTRSIRLTERLGCRSQRNLHPHPSRYRDTPEVIATLDRDAWMRMVAERTVRRQ